jgi:hypothetical protein
VVDDDDSERRYSRQSRLLLQSRGRGVGGMICKAHSSGGGWFHTHNLELMCWSLGGASDRGGRARWWWWLWSSVQLLGGKHGGHVRVFFGIDRGNVVVVVVVSIVVFYINVVVCMLHDGHVVV